MKEEILLYRDMMRRLYGVDTTHRLRKQIKFITRSLFYYPYSKRLANYVSAHPYLSKDIKSCAAVCTKLHKPYMSFQLSTKEKVEILLESYRYLDEHFSERVRAGLYEGKAEKVLELFGKDDKKIEAYLKIFTNFDKEGEFGLTLWEEEKLLATLTFSVWKGKLFIGGLQGLGRQNNDPEILKTLTKNFYGLFPKRIAIEIVSALFPMQKLAVGNANHIYLAQRYRYKKERQVKADYDEFWESLGGVEKEKGFWELPAQIPRKPMEEIPSKKRSQYRKRYEILDALEEGIASFKSEK